MLQVLVLALQGLYLLIRVFFSTLFTRLWAFILFALPSVLKKILGYFGIGLASFTGFNYLIDNLEGFIFNRFDSLPSDILNILLLAKVDKALAILFASMTIAVSIKIATKSMTFVSKGSMTP